MLLNNKRMLGLLVVMLFPVVVAGVGQNSTPQTPLGVEFTPSSDDLERRDQAVLDED
jgi:hypothetical protein